MKTAAFLDVPLSELLPEETVEMAKAPEPDGSEASPLVAGAGFEPTTSGKPVSLSRLSDTKETPT